MSAQVLLADGGRLTVNKWHARSMSSSFADALQVAIHELWSADLQALLDHFGCELVDAIVGGEAEDMLNGAALVRWQTVFADMLNAPVAELTVGDHIDAGEDFVDAWTLRTLASASVVEALLAYLVLLQTVLEDVLHHETAGLTKRNLMPHAPKSLIDALHDLWWRAVPAELKQFLPDMTSIAMNDGLGDAMKQLLNEACLNAFWNDIKSLLNNMTAEGIHAQVQDVPCNRLGDGQDLLG